MKKYQVNIHYSTFCAYEIEAENEQDAILIARQLQINKNEILNNLENWFEADTAIDLHDAEATK